MRITFLGPPGSGKGTQAERLSNEFKIPHIATGDILRNSIRKDTPIGKRVKSYLEKGTLVPDDIILELLLAKLEELENFLLDGFPRTLHQAERLEKTIPIDIVVLFQISESTIISRLTQRRICPSCSKVYNLTTDQPKVNEICDKCGTSLIIREDDCEATVRKRLKVYKEETFPLIEYYSKKCVLKYLDAEGDSNIVYQRIKQLLLKNDSFEV